MVRHLLITLISVTLIRGSCVTARSTFDMARSLICNEWSCSNVGSEYVGKNYFTEMGCFCDDLCGFFEDCCDDAPVGHGPQPDRSLRRYMKCTKNCMVHPGMRIHLVSECPEDYQNSKVAELCNSPNVSEPFFQIPATSNTTGFAYKNLFCSLCHGEQAVPWLIKIHCVSSVAFPNETSYDFQSFMGKDNCRTEVTMPFNSTDFRPCYPNVVKTCPNDTDPELKHACEAEINQKLLYQDSVVYKNPSCASCNAAKIPSCFGLVEDEEKCSLKPLKKLFYSLRILLDITTGNGFRTLASGPSSETSSLKLGNNCTGTEMYDPFLNICRGVTCLDGFEVKQGACDRTTRDLANNSIENCPTRKLNMSDFTMQEDGRLLEKKTQLVHNHGQFMRTGNSAIVCIKGTYQLSRLYLVPVLKISSLEGMISGTGMIISLVALLLTISVYLIFPPLRNIPGCNILSLSISLFFAEISMLLAPTAEKMPQLCKIFSVGMHYLFLAMFMWMNVVAVDACFTFTRLTIVSRIRKSKSVTRRFIAYSIYAWVVPTVPVITAVVLDIALPFSPYSPNYGQGVCWIANSLALAVFFAGPLALIILTNTVLYVITSVTIFCMKTSSSRLLGREYRSELIIYIKLFLVMGITWILGFLSAFVAHPVTTYLFIIVNSLQGLFISVTFVGTKKVLQLFNEKFRVQRRRDVHTNNRRVSSSSTHM